MATSTPNHGLYKYGGDDAPDLTALGPTMDKIDLELKTNADNIYLLGRRTRLSTGTDLLGVIGFMSDGEVRTFYAWDVTTALGWPATSSGFNTARIEMLSTTGYAMCWAFMSNGDVYGGRWNATPSSILWKKLN